MYCICYCYEAIKVINVDIYTWNITFWYKAIQVLKNDILQNLQKSMDLMAMRDSVYEQQ